MDIDVHKLGKVQVIRLRGSLKLGEPVDQLRSAVDGIINEGSFHVVLNLAEVPMADSSGVGALVRYHASFKQKGGALKLVSPSKLVAQTLKILGLSAIFDTFDNEDAAVHSFAGAVAGA